MPEIISPEYVTLKDRTDYSYLRNLKYPDHRKIIARLTLEDKVVWYAAQDPHQLIESDSDFHSFWFRYYILPLKLKRFFYRFKFW